MIVSLSATLLKVKFESPPVRFDHTAILGKIGEELVAQESPRKRRADRGCKCRVPPRRDRAFADRRQHRRCRDLKLCHQPRARQRAGLSRSLPRAEIGWAHRYLRCRQSRSASGGAGHRRGPALWLRRRAATSGQIEHWLTAAGLVEIRITVKPQSRELVKTWARGRGIEDYVASAA